MRLGLSPWSAAKVEVMVTFWRLRGKPGQRLRRTSLHVQEITKHRLFSIGRICSGAAALSFISIAHHVSKSDADKVVSREQIRPCR